MVGATRPNSFLRGCVGFALGTAIGLFAADLRVLYTMEASGVAPPRNFQLFYWIFSAALVGVATLFHGLGRLTFRSRRGVAAAFLTGLISTLALHLPRDAAYEAMCAPLCSGRQDAWIYVLAIAFLGGLLNRTWSREATSPGVPVDSARPSISLWAGGAIVVAILALPTFVLVYHGWYQRLSEQQYAECLKLPIPTTLGVLEQRFGPGKQVQILEFGEFKGHEDHHFEANPDYTMAWSTDISATVAPGTDKVVALFCGEGW
jgi:hypothetical protein